MGFDLQEWYNALTKKAVIMAYKGAITSELIEKFLDTVEGKLEEIKETNKLKRKVYSVLVETLQNLYHHIDKAKSSEVSLSDTQFAIVVFSRDGEKYKISTGNFVKLDKIKHLKERLDQINYLSKDELKALYRMILDNQEFSQKGGGGLGMIDIARKTGSKLNYTFHKYNENYKFFSLSILV